MNTVYSINELLKKIDDYSNNPSRREEWADVLVEIIREMVSDNRLEEICKAEKEGRLRVLSCKEGDYYIHSVIAEIKRLEDVKKNIEHLLQYEAAEAALKERDKG